MKARDAEEHGWTCDGRLMLAMVDRAERAEAALAALTAAATNQDAAT